MAARSPRRSAARRKRALSGSEKPWGQLPLAFPDDSKVADLARISPRAALVSTIDALKAELEATSAFSDWAAHCLEPETGAMVDQDEAFVSFFGFCNMVGLTGADRLPHAVFVHKLCEAGFSIGVSRDGRRFHRGCRLFDRFGSVVSARGSAEVGLFLAECCRIGGQTREDRGRSSLVYAAYCDWARARGSEPINIARFAKVLISRGFKRVRSNGHWWQGLKLLPTKCPAGRGEK